MTGTAPHSARIVAERFEMEILDSIPKITLPSNLFERVPYSFAKKHLILPIEQREERIIVAIADPLNLDPIDDLHLILGHHILPAFCEEETLGPAIDETYKQLGFTASDLLANLPGEETTKEDLSEIEVYDLLNDRDQAPIVKLLNRILTEAIEQEASDIHFEPLESGMRVRYRIDGVLLTRHTPARDYQAQLITRLKVIAGLDIAEHRLPQDGRIRLRLGGREIDFRVSTVPVASGERIVLRILDRGNVVLGLNRLGMEPHSLELFTNFISHREGIVLVTGPTGSGKTTTLYSAVNDLSSDEVNIMTIEDPVEYKLSGMAQIGVRPKIGLTFASGLRHILRQDPDIIMVGEIRDCETAEIAIQASLTGHLVLSTLHTNDAPSALTRLVDMGIEPYLLSSSVVGVIAQRLVRTLCSNCRAPYLPDDTECRRMGWHKPQQEIYRAVGCDHCFNTGYKGRHGLYEVMPLDHAIKQQILASADAVALRKLALSRGLSSLARQGVRSVESGATSLAEVLRVTRGIEEEEDELP